MKQYGGEKTKLIRDLIDEDRVSETDHVGHHKAFHRLDILYKVDEIPPWHLCLFLGFQQFLTAFVSIFGYYALISKAICIEGDDVGQGELIGTLTFVSGLSSILQATFGIRLPIIQGVSYSFVVPVSVTLSVSPSNCPYTDPAVNQTTLPPAGSEYHRHVWTSNLCQLQGSLMVASLLPIIIGCTGLISALLRYIGPLTIAPTLSLIVLSLLESVSEKGSTNWYICFMTIVLVAIFSQYLQNIAIAFPFMKGKVKIFALFSVLLAIIIAWAVCAILTTTNVLPQEPEVGYKARTDIRLSTLSDSQWFRFPYPGQWGVPSISLAGTLGMSAAMLIIVIESVGNFYACARISGAPPPSKAAINRGIFMGGFTTLLAGAWGAVAGTTPYCENIGVIGITKVGSLIVIQVAGIIMLVLGCLGKFGALFVALPEPIIGGLFYITFGVVAGLGISTLQYVDLNSSRNHFIFGLSLVFGLSVPAWVVKQGIHTGHELADQILTVLTGTSMFVGGVLSFVMDNTIPGTQEERGLIHWNEIAEGAEGDLSMYDLPIIQPFLNRWSFSNCIPCCRSTQLEKVRPDKTDKVLKSGGDNPT